VIIRVAELVLLHFILESGDEGVLDICMDVDPFDSTAGLACIRKAAICYICDRYIKICI
jgi:hypothetical protein